jgi:hypothetical protein
MIGRLPVCKTELQQSSGYWCMSKWLPEMEADTMKYKVSSVIGYRVGAGAYGGAHFTQGFMNIWVSHIYALDAVYGNNIADLGSEDVLIKRILDNNHEYRTGISRLPHTAQFYTRGTNAGLDVTKYLNVWPTFQQHKTNDTTHPFVTDFERGGEIWQIVTHGGGSSYTAMANSTYWKYDTKQLYNTNVPIRFLTGDNCHAGGFGEITNQHLLVKNSGCVLAMSPTDYVSCGFLFCDTVKNKFTPHAQTLAYLAKGDRWGRAWLRGNGWIWSTNFHGDLSLKPKMIAPNAKPVISGVTATKTGPMTWAFTVAAADSDDGITSYEWYGNGYNYGKATADSVGLSTTFSITYSAAKRCTLRVEAIDHYKARDYADIIIKTDSGIVSTSVELTESNSYASSNSLLSINPSPFNPAASIQYCLDKEGVMDLKVYSNEGRLVRTLTSGFMKAGKHVSTWDSRDNYGKTCASGVYTFVVKSKIGTVTRKAYLIR